MEIEVPHPEFKAQRIAVETAGWFRGPRLLINGSMVKKIKGLYVVATDAGLQVPVKLKYNYLDPIPKIAIRDEIIALATPLNWSQYICIGIPFTLAAIGGAIGGMCGGLGAVANGRIFRSERSSTAKYGLSVLVTIGATVAFIILATAVQLLIGKLRK